MVSFGWAKWHSAEEAESANVMVKAGIRAVL